jgi:hypothetical protein
MPLTASEPKRKRWDSEGRGKRRAVTELARMYMDCSPYDVARGEVSVDLDDVAAGFWPGSSTAAGEDAEPGGAPARFWLEADQVGGGGDTIDHAGDFSTEGDQADAGVAAVF